MKNLSVEEKALWLAIEDYSGLWEVFWEMDPELTQTQKREIAEQAVRSLLARGWIALYRCYGVSEEEQPLPLAEYEGALSDPANWNTPTAGSVQVLIGATEEGKRAYREGKLI